jgi:hypothetical protein
LVRPIDFLESVKGIRVSITGSFQDENIDSYGTSFKITLTGEPIRIPFLALDMMNTAFRPPIRAFMMEPLVR